MAFSRVKLGVALAAIALCSAGTAWADDAAKTPEQFAAIYMKAFNTKDKATLDKLRMPIHGKSPMQEMMDEMNAAEMAGGTQYTQFEVTAVPPDMDKPQMGPDGAFYQPNLKPTNVLKLTAKTENGSTSTSFPIGVKDGVYYAVGIEAASGAAPTFNSGWQRCQLPKSNWSVMLPNEPEPGRAALEKSGGKEALNDPDAYGIVQNTADIKTSQHWMQCAEEGKRIFDDGHQERYRAACTTYTPETLAKWFNDVQKNIDDTLNARVMETSGELVSQKKIDLNGAPGKEFQIKDKDGTQHWGRIYWIKDALYELTFESKKDKPDLDGANKFLGSLQVQ